MKIRLLKTGICIMATLCLMGCASLSSFQDARPVEKGKGQMLLAFTQYTEQFDEGLDLFGNQVDEMSSYVLDFGLRVGIMDNLDIGLKYTLPGGIVADGKYLLAGESGMLAVSSGLKGGYMSITSGSGDEENKYNVVDVVIPVYVSFYPIDWVAVTVTPDGIFRSNFGDNLDYKGFFLVGGNGSLKLGKNWGLMLEGGFHKNLDSQDNLINYSGVIFWPFELKFIIDLFG